jgi:hypothetical protein
MILYLFPLAYPPSLIMSCLLLYEFIVTCVCAHWLLILSVNYDLGYLFPLALFPSSLIIF